MKDEATVARVAKAVFDSEHVNVQWDRITEDSKAFHIGRIKIALAALPPHVHCSQCNAELPDRGPSAEQWCNQECHDKWQAALPSDSGLVAALEDLIHQVEGLKQEEAESFDLDQARQALAQHRAGNPWSDTPPTDMVMVPKEPTVPMRRAGSMCWAAKDFKIHQAIIRKVYKAMIEAATPPKGGDT